MKLIATIFVALCIGSTLSIGRGGVYNASYNFGKDGGVTVKGDDVSSENVEKEVNIKKNVVIEENNFTDADFGFGD
ncbi:MAG: hypothetical protein GY928_10460 [Colwellia sp.]|nr:hypothetical protein [Colwellia sp.]